jgi:hypothetical protein
MCKVMIEEEEDHEGRQVGLPLPPDEPAHVLAMHELEEKENERQSLPKRRSRPKEDIEIPVVIEDDTAEEIPQQKDNNERGQYIRTFVQEFT